MNYQNKRYKYGPETKCAVEGCNDLAEYEVVLYDFYDYYDGPETFYEQDYTCPFLCQKHLDLNEKHAEGERRPRGVVHYPYTNKHSAQGYSKYDPIKEVYPQFFAAGETENNSRVQIDLNEINVEL